MVVLTGCLRRSGRRRHLHTAYGSESNHITHVRAAGTRVAYVDTAYDHYNDGISTLLISNVVGDRPSRVIERDPYSFSDVALGAGGEVAWITQGLSHRLELQRPNGDRRWVDEGFTLASPRFIARRLAWRHGAIEASVPLESSNACSPPAHEGTMLVDLVTSATSVTACWRATGATTAAPRAPSARVSLAGAWLAVADAGAITLYNLQTATSEQIAAADAAAVIVDEHGSLWWDTFLTRRDDPQQVWVRDAQGVRQLGTVEDSILAVGRDGPVVRWIARHLGAVTLLAS